MKGYFSLNYCPYTEELKFGNLNPDMGTLGRITDCLRVGSSVCRLIAHDVIEHAAAHRTKSYVTYEDEIRALGATSFVRCSDGLSICSELSSQVLYCHRSIKPVPRIIGKFLHDNDLIHADMVRYAIREGVDVADARNAVYQLAWGEWQKRIQFDDDYYKARSAFDFIERNVGSAIRDVYREDMRSVGVSIYFDTEKHIFRKQFKRPH